MRTWLPGPAAAPSHSARIGTRSTDSTSLVTTVTFGSAARFEVGGEIAIDLDRQQPARPARPAAAVIAPRPGPISRIESSGVAATAVDQLVDPRRLRGSAARIACALSSPPSASSNSLLAASSVLDDVDLLFGHAEVVAELVDQRLADRDDDVVLVAVAVVLDRRLKQRDAIGQLLPWSQWRSVSGVP